MKSNKKVKLICEIEKNGDKIQMNVSPKMLSLDDPLSTVNHGNMDIRFTFRICQKAFASAQFSSTIQTVYSVLNDILKVGKSTCGC